MPVNAAFLRTVVVAAGLGFVAAAIGSACLDFAGEDWGVCATQRADAGAGTGPADPAVDCGAPLPPDAGVLGSGSGSASP